MDLSLIHISGLFLLGIKNAFAIAFIIAVLDILPVLGTCLLYTSGIGG